MRTNVFTATQNFVQRLKAFRSEIMMGKNNPMAIINFSDKLKFKGKGAAHIQGAAWCHIRKISQSINLTVPRSESDEEIESNSEHEPENIEEIKTRILDPDADLERAFKNSEKVKTCKERMKMH